MTENKDSNYKIHEIIISVTAFALFGVLFSVTQLFHNPFIVFGVILFVLFPFRKSRLVKIILSLSAIVFTLWFLHSISNLLAPFLVALIISYALNPLVEKMTRGRITRTWASAIILVAFLLIAATAILLLAPPIAAQFSELIRSLPQALRDLQHWINTALIPKLNSLGIPTEDMQNKLSQELPAKLENLLNTLLSGLSGLFVGLSVVLTQVVNLILIPFLTFYIMKDFDNLKGLIKDIFPSKSRSTATKYYRQIDSLLGSFIRGQLIVSVIHGIVVYIFLSILGVKFAIFLGALGILLNIIPYFGLLVEITLAVVVSLFSGDPGFQIPLVIIIYLLQNLLETSFIIPKVVGDRIGLHPALLILSLFVFSYFFGFIGMLIALPTMSIIIMFFKEWLTNKEKKEAAVKAS
ncbi:MAG: AI-2E family transporter [Ignavibacteria bacterium]|nr:AI-2E family transporter [Ignavibacteria bacterium]